ncbi:hypothetical protein D3C84_932870 [compost metagenome]
MRERIGVGVSSLKIDVILRVPETVVVEEPGAPFQPVFVRVNRHALQRGRHARMEGAVFPIVLGKMREQRLACGRYLALGHDPLAQVSPVGEFMQG